MSGWWASESNGVRMEEVWTGAAGGVMLGVHRDVFPNGKVSFEFIRIEEKGGTLIYQAQPGGRPATSFPLKSESDSKIVFENPKHDFPQRILYWREGDKLCARVEGTMDGKSESEQWCWTRVTSAPDAARR
jgi:hypothetical protein